MQVDTWFKCNKLSLNTSKTNYIMLRPNKKQTNTNQICPKINRQNIAKVSSKFWEILIDECLNFKQHIDGLLKTLV